MLWLRDTVSRVKDIIPFRDIIKKTVPTPISEEGLAPIGLSLKILSHYLTCSFCRQGLSKVDENWICSFWWQACMKDLNIQPGKHGIPCERRADMAYMASNDLD